MSGGRHASGPSIDADQVNRVAKLLVDAGDAEDFERAGELLRSYRIQILADAESCRGLQWQAALLSAVNTAVRTVHGGVRVILAEDPPCALPGEAGRRLSESLRRRGAQVGGSVEAQPPTIVFGEDSSSARCELRVHAFAGTWVAGVSPEVEQRRYGAVSVPAAVLAAALAVSECFQRLRGFAPAGERRASVSLWRPGLDVDHPDAEGPPLRELPAQAWLLGLGHVGQANAWLLSLLPYPRGGSRPLMLQDDDRLTRANQATSLMHVGADDGVRKTRVVARAMEPLGWDARLIEHRYAGGALYRPGDPMVLFAGVDNPGARHLLDDAGFPVIFDTGLGAGPDGFLSMSIRRLPAARPSRQLWPASPPTPVVPDVPIYRALANAGGDRCGVELLASRTVATAFVGLTAACWAVGGLLRELHGGERYELIDYTLRDPGRVSSVVAHEQRLARVPSVRSVETL
jgi:hypothetical protein